jgi:hypothetical protein
MKRQFKVGDHVTWNSEAGQVSGTIIKVHTKNVDYKGTSTTRARKSHSMKSRVTRPTTSPCTRDRR